MNMMVNTSELVTNEAETKKIAGTELKRAVSKLVASWERKQAGKATKLGGLGLMAISLAACNSSSDEPAAPAAPEAEAPATPAAPVINNIALANATTSVFGTTGNDNITGTATTAGAEAATTTNTITADHIIADSSTTDADVLTISTQTDFTGLPTVVGIETINFVLESVTAGADFTYTAMVDNMAANTYTVDVNKVGSPITRGFVDQAKTGTTTTFTSDFSTSARVRGKSDNESLTVNSSADTTTVDSDGTLTSATITVSGATNTVTGRTINSDSDGTVTATTTAADMQLQANTATTVVATSSGDIDATATTLAEATSVSLTSGDEMTVTMAKAATATLSAKGTGTGGTAVSTVIDGTNNLLTSLSLSGNGGAAQFDVTGAEGITTITLTGSQNVGATMDASEIDALTSNKVTVVDNTADAASANITTNLKVNGTAGDMDLTAAAVDNIDIALDNASKTITVASGANITFSGTGTVANDNVTSATIDGVDSSASTNSVTVNADDGDKTGANNTVNFATKLTFTDFKTATINVDADANNFDANTYDDTAIAALTASADNTNVTINAGANGVTLSGTTTTGTGALTINSEGAVGLGAAAITASAFTHTGGGAVTHTALNTANLATYTTGSGNDSITVSATNGNLTLNTGAGNDDIILTAATTTAKTYAITGGAGSDRLVIDGGGAAADLNIANGTEVITLDGVETIFFNEDTGDNAIAVSVPGALLNNAALILDQEAAADVLTLTAVIGSTITNLNLSNLTVNTDNLAGTDIISVTQNTALSDTTIVGTNGMKMTFAGNSGADTLTGGDQDDSLTGNGGNDIITGAAGNDTINGNAGADVLTGGAGDDIISGDAAADTLTGGAGDDTYVYDTGDAASGETIVEASAGGTDVISVNTTTDFSAMAASSFDEIETVSVAATQTATFTAAQLTGETIALNSAGSDNAVINMSFGETADLSGVAGTFGAAGTDTVTINGTGGAETLVGTGEADTISLGAGGDTIKGGAGNDIITMGSGVDTLQFTFGTAGNDIDTVASITLGASKDVIDFTGTSDISGAGVDVDGFSLNAGSAAFTLVDGMTVINGGVQAVDAGATLTAAEVATFLGDMNGVGAGTLKVSVGASADVAYMMVEGQALASTLVRVTGGADTTIDAADVTLIAHFTATEAEDFLAGNFADFA